MKKTICAAIIAAFVGMAANLCAQAPQRPMPPAFDPTNPTVHDPVMIKEGDTYYLFCTGMGVSILESNDMKTWRESGSIFTEAPAWTMEALPGFRGHMWAPDVIYHNGLYHVFYACSAFAKNTSVIGHVTNTTLDRNNPAYKWVDQGKIIQSVPNRDMWNAIDANIVIDDNGTPWMDFGSFWDGIKMVKLTPDLMAVAQPEEWYSLSRRARTHTLDDTDPGDGAVEAPFIFRKNGYYYLLVSFDYCCRGLNSDYKIAVGRSKNVEGPYFDKDGMSMAIGGGTIIAAKNKDYVGVGHCAAYSFDDGDYLIAHGYDAKTGESKLVVRKMKWDNDGWFSIDF